jgi:hypothetical protein
MHGANVPEGDFMQKMSRKLDPHVQIERLEQRHWALEQQIAELDRQRYLTATEELALHSLKRQKLATKDQLAELQTHAWERPLAAE